MKNILVLTDFSIRAEFAAKFAAHIAIKNNANLLLCNVVNFPEGDAHGSWVLNQLPPDMLQFKTDCMMDLKALGRTIEQEIKNDKGIFKPSIGYLSRFGDLTAVTKTIIAEKSIDMVVIASHRANRLIRLLSGSDAHRMLDQLSCPILIVPESFTFRGIKTIGYATDLTFDNSKALDYLVEMAKPFDATLAINYVSPVGFPVTSTEREGAFSMQFKANHNTPPVLYNNVKANDMKAALIGLTTSGQVDILAMVHKQYDFIEGLFHTSVCKQVAQNAQIPLLVLPESYGTVKMPRTNDVLNYGYQTA